MTQLHDECDGLLWENPNRREEKQDLVDYDDPKAEEERLDRILTEAAVESSRGRNSHL